jgi:hypothetical protein
VIRNRQLLGALFLTLLPGREPNNGFPLKRQY